MSRNNIGVNLFNIDGDVQFFCFVGVGSQFLALATGIMVMAVLGMFNVHRHGAINSAGIVLYAFTSCKSWFFLVFIKRNEICDTG